MFHQIIETINHPRDLYASPPLSGSFPVVLTLLPGADTLKLHVRSAGSACSAVGVEVAAATSV